MHLFLLDSLGEHDLLEVLTKIDSVNEVEFLGLALGLLITVIEKIQVNFAPVREQKIEIIKCWLKGTKVIQSHPPPTWSHVADACN